MEEKWRMLRDPGEGEGKGAKGLQAKGREGVGVDVTAIPHLTSSSTIHRPTTFYNLVLELLTNGG